MIICILNNKGPRWDPCDISKNKSSRYNESWSPGAVCQYQPQTNRTCCKTRRKGTILQQNKRSNRRKLLAGTARIIRFRGKLSTELYITFRFVASTLEHIWRSVNVPVRKMLILPCLFLACFIAVGADLQFEETKHEKQKTRASPALNDSASDFDGNAESLARALDFYNTQILRSNWDSVGKNLSSECQKDMREYLKGLKTGKNWALKSWYNLYLLRLSYNLKI